MPSLPWLTTTTNSERRWRYSNAASNGGPHSEQTVPTTRAISSGTCARWGDAPCRTERTRPAQRDRRSNDQTSRLSPNPASVQAGRRGLRPDQDGRGGRRAALHRPDPRQVLIQTLRGGLQPHTPGQHLGGRRITERRRRVLGHRNRDPTSHPQAFKTPAVVRGPPQNSLQSRGHPAATINVSGAS